MATSNGIITSGWSGGIGREVVFKQRNGQTVISAYPTYRRSHKRTEKQLAINRRMMDAHRNATYIINNKELANEAQLRLNVTRNRLYTSLISEYFKQFRSTENQQQRDITDLPDAQEASKQFVTYLLNSTNKSIEEIAELTKVPLQFVQTIKNRVE
jgi:hypothetical protein